MLERRHRPRSNVAMARLWGVPRAATSGSRDILRSGGRQDTSATARYSPESYLPAFGIDTPTGGAGDSAFHARFLIR
jgi:hypothetical protein